MQTLKFLLATFCLLAQSFLLAQALELEKTALSESPLAYKGRYRPAGVAARSWAHETVGKAAATPLAELWLLELHSLPASDPYEERLHTLTERNLTPEAKSEELKRAFPLNERLKDAGNRLLQLPSKSNPALWYPLETLTLRSYDPKTDSLNPLPNFTVYSDSSFAAARHAYIEFKNKLNASDNPSDTLAAADTLGKALLEGYEAIAGKAYLQTANRTLAFPSIRQLHAESLYNNLPFLAASTLMYIVSAVLLAMGWLYAGTGMMLAAWLLNTALLALRIYILERPPVSNMYETLLFVPWIAATAAPFFALARRSYYQSAMAASAATAGLLLLLAYFSPLSNSLENVQAVLDSHYWLTIHVLMIVGSYGLFILGGITAHAYLCLSSRPHIQSYLSAITLQTICGGIALLIPGTILGGIWAAQSWGRFWDWDPKEAWAFITICSYLFTIHAYRYLLIGPLGLCLLAITGAWITSFTWYGVNFILGSGLHSYGFGNDSGWHYYAFAFLCDFVLLAMIIFSQRKVDPQGVNRP